MPPLIGKAGDGFQPVVTNPEAGVQDVKSAKAESPEQQKDVSNPETAAARRASAKEASTKKAELDLGAASQKSALDRQLKEKEGNTAAKPNVIQGTSGDDKIHISKAPGLLGLQGLYEVDINGQKQYMTKDQLKNTEFRTGAGNDTVVVDSDVKVGVTVDGGSGNDVIIGGGGNDNLKGGSGRDVIAGRGGDDRVSGGRGNDVLLGGEGNDIIDGGTGNDNIVGGRGNDKIHSGKGNDSIKAGRGMDDITTGGSQDITDKAKKN